MAYRLRNTQTNEVLEVWGSLPAKLSVPDVGDVHCVAAGWAGGNYAFEEFAEVVAPLVLEGYHVNTERDRRLSTYTFGGRSYQFDVESQVNVAGAGTLSLAAIIAGKLANDLRWADPDKDFAWLAADNTVVTMDAQTTLAFAQAAARWKADHIHAARAIKNLSPIPADYAANVRWPT